MFQGVWPGGTKLGYICNTVSGGSYGIKLSHNLLPTLLSYIIK